MRHVAIVTALLLSGLIGSAAPARAQAVVYPGYPAYAPYGYPAYVPPPVVYPPPVYAAPAPVYAAPPVVYAPGYYAPAPAVGVFFGFHGRR